MKDSLESQARGTGRSVTLTIDADSPAAKLKAWIERVAALLDPDYPSIIVEPPPAYAGVNSALDGLMGRPKPAMVAEDDKGWVVEI